jgi:hypothetical protein
MPLLTLKSSNHSLFGAYDSVILLVFVYFLTSLLGAITFQKSPRKLTHKEAQAGIGKHANEAGF